MDAIALNSAAFFVALGCAALMGFAIQRGATCMVAAVGEVVTERRLSRFVALLEAGIWVAGGLIVARLFGGLVMPPADYPLTAATVTGGLLLGLGALVNRACVFGAIARIGSGEWAYLLTPVGFFLGCWGAHAVTVIAFPMRASASLSGAVFWPVIPFCLFVAWRALGTFGALRQRQLAQFVWSPHRATAVIGIAFVVMMLTVGNWAYTEALAALAQGQVMDAHAKALLFLGLLVGALSGGWTAGRIQPVMPGVGACLRCLSGGALMGVGSLLIPGGNDGLLLIGLPLLQPYALAALASMAVVIAAGMVIEARLTLCWSAERRRDMA